MPDAKPEPITETFTRKDGPPGEIVFTPLPIDDLGKHPLFLASQLSLVNRKRVTQEACAAWVVQSDWFKDGTDAALLVWFKPGPVGYDGVFLTPEKGAKKLAPAPAVLLMRDGVYHLLVDRDVGLAVLPLLEANPDTQAPHDPDDEPDVHLL